MFLRHAAFVGLFLAAVPAAARQTAGPQGNPAPRALRPAQANQATETAQAGIIRGTVTAADTGNPLRGADIRIDGGGLPRFEPRSVRTDAQGATRSRTCSRGATA